MANVDLIHLAPSAGGAKPYADAAKYHPTQQAESWRNGFAKRAVGFSEMCAKARAWRTKAVPSIGRIQSAIAVGMPEVSLLDRQILQIYVRHLNYDRLKAGRAGVWLSNATVAEYAGVDQRSVRRANSRLEAQGWIVRDYTPKNQRAGEQAISLDPLLSRIDELETRDREARARRHEARLAQNQPIVGIANESGAPDSDAHLNSPPKNQSKYSKEARTSQDATKSPLARPRVACDTNLSLDLEAPEPRTNPQEGSSEKRSRPQEETLRNEQLKAEIALAVELEPRLRQYVSQSVLDDPGSFNRHDADDLAEAAKELLPGDRNPDDTVRSCAPRQGARLIVGLAIALNRGARCPNGYFGWMACKSDQNIDLRLNLRTLLAQKHAIPTSTAPSRKHERAREAATITQSVQDPVWQALSQKLRLYIDPKIYGSYFERIAYGGIDGEVLTLLPRTETAAIFIQRNHGHDILHACRKLEIPVNEVRILGPQAR